MLKSVGYGQKAIALVLFAVAFGYLEASIVVYLRSIYEPMRAEIYHPESPADELFPVLTLQHLKDSGPEHEKMLYIELGREFATLVMLATVAWAVAGTWREWIAWFGIMFGVWDILFYLFLLLLIDWPSSVWQWDILFLLPVIWSGPVLSPLLVSVGLIGAGAWVIGREAAGRPYLAPGWCWVGVVVGGIVIIVAFCWDWRNVAAGNVPNPFAWVMFLVGLLGGLGCFVAGEIKKKVPG